MIKETFIILLLLISQLGVAQFQDDFSDGDFTNNPEWIGDTDNFSIDNGMLRLTAPAVSDASCLATESQSIEDAVWEFYVEMDFQPSGSNLTRVYLVSNSPNLNGNLNGYFVEIGGSNREISLFKQTGTTREKIIAGAENSVLMSFVNTRVQVTRDETGNWELFRDTLGGTDYISEGVVFDDTYVQGFYFGVNCIYTATRSDRFYFDDFNVSGDAFFDPNSPALQETNTLSQNTVELVFDKPIQEASAENIANYNLNNGIGAPSSAVRDENDFSRIELTFASNFTLGTFYILSTNNITDFSGNVAGPQTGTVLYIEPQTPEYGDIIINEFLPRESPSQGLPERQFVEIYNRSNKFFHLDGWKLSDRTGTGTIQDAWIYPDSILILVPTSGLSDFSGAVINVSNWQSLNNSGDDIILETNDSILVDNLSYTDAWYQDENKKNGGWSIERVNPELVCSGADNWRASVSSIGGTPGEENSVFALTPDVIPPSIIELLTIDDNTLQITFSEGMDGEVLQSTSFLTVPSLTLDTVLIEVVYPNQALFVFEEDFVPGEVYDFEILNVADCNGNETNLFGSFVLPQIPNGDEIIINEILFRPLTGGSDFVELYNNSDKYINLKNWELANFNNDTVANNRVIEQNYILEPDDYVVITRDSSFQLVNYPFAVPGKFIQLPSLPSYTTDSSTVFLIYNDSVVDKVSYSRDWHFKLINDNRGVSLERFDPDGPSNDENNWHSAAESVSFATPGRINSQINNVTAEGTLTLSNNSFSPDNDGFQDVLLITWELTDPEMLGKMVVYDDVGRKTKTLFSDYLLGNTGTVKWDGVKEDGTKASIGPYIILFEAFNADTGEKITIRKVVTLAGQL
jgi:hypothetical protein